MFRSSLQQTIAEKNIQGMFQNPAILDQICQVAPQKVEQLCQLWRLPREIGMDIVKLALFDIILYIGALAFPSPPCRFCFIHISLQSRKAAEA
jgi:hypothetical protein